MRSWRRSCGPRSTPSRSPGRPPRPSPRCATRVERPTRWRVVERGLIGAGQHDERFAPLADRAAALAAEAGELARDVADAAEEVELDPASRAAAEERLGLLYDLRRKYGDTIEAVVAFGAEAAEELDAWRTGGRRANGSAPRRWSVVRPSTPRPRR